MAESNFWEKFFSARKSRKYAGNRRFSGFSLDFLLIFRCFSHKNIINNNIHHQEWFNCQYNWFLLPELSTADFRRKNGISWISRAVLYIFSWKFAHWWKMIVPKMWRSLVFEKHFFPAENAGNMPEKPGFWHFVEISSLVSSDFLHKDAY